MKKDVVFDPGTGTIHSITTRPDRQPAAVPAAGMSVLTVDGLTAVPLKALVRDGEVVQGDQAS